MSSLGAPSARRVNFRGFLASAGLFFTGFLVFGIGVYAFTQFLQPLQSEFGWNRT